MEGRTCCRQLGTAALVLLQLCFVGMAHPQQQQQAQVIQQEQQVNRSGMHLKNKREAEMPVPNQQDVQMPHNDKRAALILDKLMFALQKALDEPEEGYGPAAPVPEALRAPQVDLQRRGQTKGRYYVPCFFNAITCYRKK